MKVKIHGHMDLEQFSHQIQLAIAKLQDSGVKYVKGANLYLTPVDQYEDEVSIRNERNKIVQEIEIKHELK
jgi:hypothetical protein